MKILSHETFPKQMKALRLHEPEQPLMLSEEPIPFPKAGEVLVKIDSSPINPSDLSFLQGTYSTEKELPAIPGFEASGKVVACGDDFMSRRLLGKNVACFALADGNGTWAQFMRTRSRFVIPLHADLNVEQGAMLLVNPLSVVAMIDIAKRGGHKAIANTAAAGALGQLLNRMCTQSNLPIVNIVRRKDQTESLQSQGAQHVLHITDEQFDTRLKEKCKELGVTLAFDAVAGDTTQRLIRALPAGGEVMIYGGLSKEAALVNPGELIFRNKKVSGFWLTPWLSTQSPLNRMRHFRQVQKFLVRDHVIRIHQRVPLDGVNHALAQYQNQMTAGKFLVQPWKNSETPHIPPIHA